MYEPALSTYVFQMYFSHYAFKGQLFHKVNKFVIPREAMQQNDHIFKKTNPQNRYKHLKGYDYKVIVHDTDSIGKSVRQFLLIVHTGTFFL